MPNNDEEITYTVKHPSWWEKWLNPTTAMAIFGAIVWGIQLNFIALQNREDIGKLEATQTRIVDLVQAQQEQSIRQTVLLEQLERRIRNAEANQK